MSVVGKCHMTCNLYMTKERTRTVDCFPGQTPSPGPTAATPRPLPAAGGGSPTAFLRPPPPSRTWNSSCSVSRRRGGTKLTGLTLLL